MTDPRAWTLEKLTVGASACFEKEVTEVDIESFALLTGDWNPLHMDRAYAQRAGYRDRIVHGALLAGWISRLIGMEIPGRQSLLLSTKIDHVAPTFPKDKLEVSGTIQSVHREQGVVLLNVYIRCGGEVRARGVAMVKIRPQEI
jgi:acyl dehydratase